MRLVGFLDNGVASIGVVTGDEVRSLCPIDDFYAEPTAWQSADPTGAPQPLDAIQQVPAVPTTAKVLCLGLNYAEHIAETGSKRPDAPNIFARWYASLSCDNDEVPVPANDDRFDWECELAVIIGSPMTNVSKEQALAGVLGYSCFNDISARGYQRRTPQWALGKNADRSAPLGPVVVTADEFGDPHDKRISTRVNGVTRQDSSTSLMLFRIAETIEFITGCTSLVPGDVIATGTPSGVGDKMDPPTYLTAGDLVEVEIEDIGALRSRIVARS